MADQDAAKLTHDDIREGIKLIDELSLALLRAAYVRRALIDGEIARLQVELREAQMSEGSRGDA